MAPVGRRPIPNSLAQHAPDHQPTRGIFCLQFLAGSHPSTQVKTRIRTQTPRNFGLERDANALPAAGEAQGIEGVQGAGVKIDRGRAARFREAVLGKSDNGRAPRTQSDSLAGAVDKILLDRMLEIDLSESVPQIGAPAAWEAGFTGEGVTVAVLDTGVDASHPDLEGQVIDQKAFVTPHPRSGVFAVEQLDDQVRYVGVVGALPVPKQGSADPLVHVGRACVDSEGDELLADPAGRTALIDHPVPTETCTFAEKYDAAVGAGATAVVFVDNGPGLLNATIVGAEHEDEVWAAMISGIDGAAMLEMLDAGEEVVLGFGDQPFVGDDHGHGTHVASTIAGAGASDGARRGVAPDAELLSGKVCDFRGQCPTSATMAAMEWAAEQGADVVNMSLGSDAASDGTDPQSQLLNQLSAETGVLFVTSAGNAGGFQRVSSPAAADAALAVGAVDKSDQMADFSSRGPRIDDHAVKPEITAPGVDIVAARAAGTGIGDPVDDAYTAVNGTSMASPHVAGAAALLAQAMPDLDGAALKDALVSTAADGGHMWFEQGTGRVDVPAVLDGPVYADGTIHFADVDAQPEQELTYTNRSDSDITLALDITVTDRDGQPIDGVSLSTDTLTVPAHGQAAVTVTVDTLSGFGFGPFGGVVTATGDSVDLRTAVGFGRPLPQVTIEVLDSRGKRIGTSAARDEIVRLVPDTADWEVDRCCSTPGFRTSEGVATGRVTPGIYTAMVRVGERDPETGDQVRESLLSEVEVLIESDTTITLDARETERVEVTTPKESVARARGRLTLYRMLPPDPDGGSLVFRINSVNGPLNREGVFVTPSETSEIEPMQLAVNWVLAEPQPLHRRPDAIGECVWPYTFDLGACYSEAPAYMYRLAFLYEDGVPADLHEIVTRDELVKVPTRYHAEQPDAIVQVVQGSRWQSDGLAFTTGGTLLFGMAIQAGEVTEYYLADDRILWKRATEWISGGLFTSSAVVHERSTFDVFVNAEAGTTRVGEAFHAAPLRTGIPDLRAEQIGHPALDGEALVLTGVRGGADGNQFNPPWFLVGNDRGHYGTIGAGLNTSGFVSADTVRMWNLNTGQELSNAGTRDDPFFQLAPEEATYRLEQADEIPERFAEDVDPLLRTGRASTTWAFTSRPSTARAPDTYGCPGLLLSDRICQIQPLILLEYDLDLDVYNRAPAGRAHRFTVTAGHHSKAIDRAKVTDLSVQASFDDGETWVDARVVGKPKDTWETGGFLPSSAPYQEFRVVLKIPPLHRTTGYVTLRVKAQDANGGTIDQTIDRAYMLKAGPGTSRSGHGHNRAN